MPKKKQAIQIRDDWENKTNEEIKASIITELYNTGKIDGVYMKKFSKSKENPLLFYINRWLKLKGINNTLDDYALDIYNEAFYYLARVDADKFVNDFAYNTNKLTAWMCLTIKLNCFYVRPNGYCKASLFDYMQFTSSFDKKNIIMNLMSTDEQHDTLLDAVKDRNDNPLDNDKGFLTQYGFDVEDIISELTAEEKEVFYNQLGKVRASTEEKQKRIALAQRLIEIKEKLTNDRKRPLL